MDATSSLFLDALERLSRQMNERLDAMDARLDQIARGNDTLARTVSAIKADLDQTSRDIDEAIAGLDLGLDIGADETDAPAGPPRSYH